jgi:hypothetical protein
VSDSPSLHSSLWSGFPPSFYASPRSRLYLGDVYDSLRLLPSRSIHCVVTSPPYWGLRDYKVGSDQIGNESVADCLGWATKKPCGSCFVCHMVEVFTEVRRVLRDDGTVWLNLGDTFDGDQQMIPASVALALKADGWVLRQDIIWYAPNKVPESVTNRCTKSHEHIFLLAKSTDYYYDMVAIEEEATPTRIVVKGKSLSLGQCKGMGIEPKSGNAVPGSIVETGNTKNKRDVWVVTTGSKSGTHFATFSDKLITPCILAGTSEYGCCAVCGKPYTRLIVKGRTSDDGSTKGFGYKRDRSFDWSRNGKEGTGSTLDTGIPTKETVGWQKECACSTTEVLPCTVLDPFVGSGTTVVTSMQLGRAGVGIDLSEEYLVNYAIPGIEKVFVSTDSLARATTTSIQKPTPPARRRLRGQ